MRSLNGKAVLPFALALAAGSVAPQHAFAQFFFRPFAYSYSYQAPPAEAPRFASRRAVASILGREGYRLVGPLGHRGEQIVAAGVSRREGEMRFIIDPYEGRILRAVRLGPPPAYDRGPRYGDGYGPAGVDPSAPPAAGAPYPPSVGRSGPAARDLGNEGYPDADGARQAPGGATLRNAAPDRSAKQRARTARTGAAPAAASRTAEPTTPPTAPTAAGAGLSEPKAAPVAQPELKSNIDAAKTPAASAPAQEASAPTPNAATETPDKAAADGAAAAQTGETAKTARAAEPTETARGSQPSAERSTQPAPAKRAAAARGSSRRAIVPPRASNGVTVAPVASAPAVSKPADAATTAKTPAGAATTAAGG